jgi:hypothetical protein
VLGIGDLVAERAPLEAMAQSSASRRSHASRVVRARSAAASIAASRAARKALR